MTPDDLDALRPTLDEGNYFLELLRAGDLKWARLELTRIEARYDQAGMARAGRTRWLAWCRAASALVAKMTVG